MCRNNWIERRGGHDILCLILRINQPDLRGHIEKYPPLEIFARPHLEAKHKNLRARASLGLFFFFPLLLAGQRMDGLGVETEVIRKI